jgi:rhodanese-related sulfurtransferase
LARAAYDILSAKGFKNLKVLDEGIPGWYQKGYPVEGSRV